MNIIQKAEASLESITNDFFEGKIDAQEFDSLKQFPESILEKEAAKKTLAQRKAMGGLPTAEHKKLWIEDNANKAEEVLMEKEEEKSPEEISDLIDKATTGRLKETNRRIGQMSQEEHRDFWRAMQTKSVNQ